MQSTIAGVVATTAEGGVTGIFTGSLRQILVWGRPSSNSRCFVRENHRLNFPVSRSDKKLMQPSSDVGYDCREIHPRQGEDDHAIPPVRKHGLYLPGPWPNLACQRQTLFRAIRHTMMRPARSTT
jgi:hypothetical protein